MPSFFKATAIALINGAIVISSFSCVQSNKLHAVAILRYDSNLITQIQSAHVTIETPSGWGSGTMIKNSNKIYVLTNHHVVAISEKDDKCHSQATIYYDIYENGRFKYRKKVSATVLVASKHPDVALLLLDADISSIKKDGLTFCNRQVLVGTSVLQCGSFYGLMGSAAITDGIISYVPRFYDGDEYYGTTTVAPPGCSGGANYALDGTFIGMNSKSAGVGSNLIVPSYVIKTWLENRQYGFLIN